MTPSPPVDDSFLDRETEHFYQAELGHDQRGSWFLALCSLILLFLIGALTAEPTPGACSISRGWVIASLIPVSLATLSIVLSLWPLAGSRPRFRRVWWTSRADAPLRNLSSEDHYVAHRRRAERKAFWIVLSILLLLVGLGVIVTGAILCKPVVETACLG